MVSRQGYILLPLELIFGFLFWSWNRKKKTASPIVLIYLFLILYRVFFTCMMSGFSFDSIKTMLYRELGLLFFCWMYLNGKNVVLTIKWIRNIGVIISILGCLEFATRSNFFVDLISVESRVFMQSLVGTSAARVLTVFLHPIICGVYQTVFWFCVLVFPYKKEWINYFAKAVILISLLGTQSRSSWFAFIVVNIIYLWKKQGKIKVYITKNKLYRLFLLVGIFAFIMVLYRDAIFDTGLVLLNRMLDAFDSTHLGNYNRVTMIKMGIAEWITMSLPEKLFGAGNGYAISYLKAHSIRGWNTAVDNQYITFLLDAGLIGLLWLLSLGVLVFVKYIKSDNRIHNVAGLSILSMFVSCFFYEMFSWITVTFLFCLFICMLGNNIDEYE